MRVLPSVVALIRRGRLTPTQGRRVIQGFRDIPLRYLEVEVERAVELATNVGVCAYDAYVLETARVRRAPVLTLDRRLGRVAGRVGIETVGVE